MDEKIRNAVNAIVRDLSDRRGLKSEWDACDEGIQQEIKNEWASLIAEALEV